jgi:hypothetical protein
LSWRCMVEQMYRSTLCHGRCTLGENVLIHWIESWVGHRNSPDDMERSEFLTLQGPEILPLSRVAHS